MGSQALLDLRDAFLRLSLLCQCPAVQYSTQCHPMRKSLLCGETDGAFGILLRGRHLAAELMEQGSNTQGITQVKGVCHLLCQGQRLLAPHQPLLRIAQTPQRRGSQNMTHYTSVVPIEGGRGAVLRG